MPDRDLQIDAHTDRDRAEALARGDCGDPFAILGPHWDGEGLAIRAYLPGARAVRAISRTRREILCEMNETEIPGFFVGRPAVNTSYLLDIAWPDAQQETEDPYSFGPVLGDVDLHLFSEGTHLRLAEDVGTAMISREGVEGVRFTVWAPNARRVSVVGDFNNWDGRRHPMRLRHSAGVWELFVPRLRTGERYKYEIADRFGNVLPLKADPLARATERPPATASVVAETIGFSWGDAEWMTSRGARQSDSAPISIYEVHAGSWRKPSDNPEDWLDWNALSEQLIPYVVKRGFTHIEFMPIMEHPFAGSWGYQPLSQFAPSARLGRAIDFAKFVDTCHRVGIGVILDWVPAHFPNDAHGLARFDGTALYEHEDPREGFHPDWNTYVYNLGRREVQGFLIASALYWLETFHVDGLRVDAVASMLYRDYSRREGAWIPNRYGGRENLEAIAFLRRLNDVVRGRCPGAITIAEESTAWPGVTARTDLGGLGFSYKWNMGWMHDTLAYLGRDPVHRRYHHGEVTFGLVYAFAERFILPLSHDEVVYGKGSLLHRAQGDDRQKAAALRAYLCFMWTHPGKKLLFMGGEFGQTREWNHDGALDWSLAADPLHAGIAALVADLNGLLKTTSALHARDTTPLGFQWIIGDDAENSVFAYARRAESGGPVVTVVNFTPLERQAYRIGLPLGGSWRERLNSDAGAYGGANRGNCGTIVAHPTPSHGLPFSAELYLPPLSALILVPHG